MIATPRPLYTLALVMTRTVQAIAVILVLLCASCSHDPADLEYLEALRGEETGISRQTQIAHIDRAIALAPDRTQYWETRGIYHIDLREFSAAINDLDRAIALGDRPTFDFCVDSRCVSRERLPGGWKILKRQSRLSRPTPSSTGAGDSLASRWVYLKRPWQTESIW